MFTEKNEFFCIEIYDSGDSFDDGVLINLGQKRITTHRDTGSGIGLLTAYNIFKRNRISFIIDETVENEMYTKKLCILLNKSFMYKLITLKNKHSLIHLEKRSELEVVVIDE